MQTQHESYADDHIRRILTGAKNIALVGASANRTRPSYGVMQFLMLRGYQVTPVNPGLSGQELQGQKVYASLADVPTHFDMVDVFRTSSALPALVDDILALPHLPKVLWTQLGVFDLNAAARVEARGVEVIMNRCPAIEMLRLQM